MQLVSRKVLFDIASTQKPVQLSESESSAFQEFVHKATSEYQTAKRKSKPNAKFDTMDIFSNAMLRYMKDNVSQIKYVGQGSSRLVYAMADGTAFKLAKNSAGIAQNRQEAKVCMSPLLKYAVFPDFYGADTKNWLALNCELCAPAAKEDFKELFMAQPHLIARLIEFMMKSFRPSSKSARQMVEQTQKFYHENAYDVRESLAKRILAQSTPAEKALFSLIEFYFKNGLDELLIGDLYDIDNWGISIREGQKTLVIIDVGFNEQVWQDYYSR